MMSYVVNQIPQHALSPHTVLLAILLTTVVACIDPVGTYLWRAYQRHAVARWDARKARLQARNQAVNMTRSAFPLKDYSDHPPMQWVPKPRIDSGIARLRAAGRGVKVGRR